MCYNRRGGEAFSFIRLEKITINNLEAIDEPVEGRLSQAILPPFNQAAADFLLEGCTCPSSPLLLGHLRGGMCDRSPNRIPFQCVLRLGELV